MKTGYQLAKTYMPDEIVFTVPHMGQFSRIFCKSFLEKLGLKTILTPSINDETIKEGIHLSGEQFCMPFKISIGDIKKGIELGANTVLYTANCGPCRYGRYWDVILMRLREAFHKNIDLCLIMHGNEVESIYSIVEEIFGKIDDKFFVKIFYHSVCLLDQLIEIESKYRSILARAINKHEVRRYFDKNLPKLLYASSIQELIEIKNMIIDNLNRKLQYDYSIPKIFIVGEIYDLIEPSANLYIVDKLADLDIETQFALNYNDLANFRFPYDKHSKNALNDAYYLVSKIDKGIYNYFNMRIKSFGGYGKTNIGFSTLAKEMGFDGIIHIAPFSCMPEIIAKPFIEKVCKQQNIPALFLTIDEHFNEENYNTRIQAFSDMVTINKNKRLL